VNSKSEIQFQFDVEVRRQFIELRSLHSNNRENLQQAFVRQKAAKRNMIA
jgi:hypothetical protein